MELRKESEWQGRSGLNRPNPQPHAGVYNHVGTVHQHRALEDRQANPTEEKEKQWHIKTYFKFNP